MVQRSYISFRGGTMEFLGLFAFIMIICYASYPNKVKKIERKMRKIKKINAEELELSKIINELVGKACKITTSDSIQIVEDTVVLDVDADWVKIEKTNKKNIKSVAIIRIDDIKKIDLVVE